MEPELEGSSIVFSPTNRLDILELLEKTDVILRRKPRKVIIDLDKILATNDQDLTILVGLKITLNRDGIECGFRANPTCKIARIFMRFLPVESSAPTTTQGDVTIFRIEGDFGTEKMSALVTRVRELLSLGKPLVVVDFTKMTSIDNDGLLALSSSSCELSRTGGGLRAVTLGQQKKLKALLRKRGIVVFNAVEEAVASFTAPATPC